MSVFLSINGSLTSASDQHPGGGAYTPVAVGAPLAIQVLTFFPGNDVKEFGRYAEIMLSSHLKEGPSNEPAAKRVLLLETNWDTKNPKPITDWGGDSFGDKMVFYAKSFTGERLSLTLSGAEIDVSNKRIEQVKTAISNVTSGLSTFASFTPAGPFIALGGSAAKTLLKIYQLAQRNQKLSIRDIDFSLNSINERPLQSGRFVLVADDTLPASFKTTYKLNSENLLVHTNTEAPYETSPYWVLKINNETHQGYDDFDMWSGVSKLLGDFDDSNIDIAAGAAEALVEVAGELHDGMQLKEVSTLLGKYNNNRKPETLEQLRAHAKLLSPTTLTLFKPFLDNLGN